ncbi:MAG: SDR family oxidoreductase [Pseudomonadota bacterium]
MQVTMSGRRALVTGGSLGIGRAIAARFLGAGADVAIVARRSEILDDAVADLSKFEGRRVVPIAADIATAEGCERAYAQAMSALGGVDVLVNNAGSSKRGAFESLTDDDWQSDFDLKVFAAVRLSRLAMPGMRVRRWGRIINVLNTAAKAPPATGAPTAVSRAAGLALTKVLAGEGAPDNVLVNALLVGRIESDQWVRRHAAEDGSRSLSDYYAAMGAEIPIGRVGTAEEFANAACFLASEQGSYITGTAINVDGGMCPVV